MICHKAPETFHSLRLSESRVSTGKTISIVTTLLKVEKKDPNLLSVEDVREHCKLIRRSVETKEVHFLSFPQRLLSSAPNFILFQARFMLRVLRALPVTRRKMNPIVLRSVMKTFYTADGDRDTKDSLLKFVAEVRSSIDII